MTDSDFVAHQFEPHRAHLRTVGFRMLGSLSEADDAVQEAWLRLNRTDAAAIDNLGGWLTTVVGRVCLTMLQARSRRREDPLDDHRRDPVITPAEDADPAEDVILADSVGLALLVVLETLSPAERLAFVLHDLFAVPFEQIAPVVQRSEPAVRQLASRARRRVQGAEPRSGHDLAHQRAVVDAFFAAARRGDFGSLVAVLDPDAVLRSEHGPQPEGSTVVRGAEPVARRAAMFADPGRRLRPVLVDGAVGVLVTVEDRLVSIMRFGVTGDRITAIDAIADRARLGRVDLKALRRDMDPTVEEQAP
ncbi:MAG: sigma-70 family RNA polymerase sigma factor [bacterium]